MNNLLFFRASRQLTITLLVAFAAGCSCAQTLQIRKRIPIARPFAVSGNAQGNLFIGDVTGTVRMYDTSGVAVNVFSPQRVAEVTSLEAWQGLRVFGFYRDVQEFVMLDRFLTPLPGYARPVRIHLPDGGFVRLATLSADGQLWLLDDTGFSLRKYNPTTRQVTLQVPLELVLDRHDYRFSCIREYQNILFLNDPGNGVILFDNAGNFRKKLNLGTGTEIELYEDELFFVRDGRIIFINLYDDNIRSVYLPDGINPLYVTVLSGKVFLITGRELIICNPSL